MEKFPDSAEKNTQQLLLACFITAFMNTKQLSYTMLPTLQVTKNYALKKKQQVKNSAS
jgi:hypothetical protein